LKLCFREWPKLDLTGLVGKLGEKQEGICRQRILSEEIVIVAPEAPVRGKHACLPKGTEARQYDRKDSR